MAKNQTYNRIRDTELKTVEKYLNRKKDRSIAQRFIPVLDDASRGWSAKYVSSGNIVRASTADSAGLWPQVTPVPDGARTTFYTPTPYEAGTLMVYVNRFIQLPGVAGLVVNDYEETDPPNREFTMTVAPYDTDVIIVQYEEAP